MPPSEGGNGNSGGAGSGIGIDGPVLRAGGGCNGCGDTAAGMLVVVDPTTEGEKPGINCDTLSLGNSVIDNYTFNYIHFASDYRVPRATYAPGFGTL